MTAPIAVLGLGGIGGMLAVRTGALCVGTERTVDAIRERGLRLVHDGETTVAHLEAVDAARDAGRRCSSSRSRRTTSLRLSTGSRSRRSAER